MKKENLILFSAPTPEIKNNIKEYIFPETLKEKVMAYMPSDGSNKEAVEKYAGEWENYARQNNSEFILIDNSQRNEKVKDEIEKLNKANILVISGGNTFKLLKPPQRIWFR